MIAKIRKRNVAPQFWPSVAHWVKEADDGGAVAGTSKLTSKAPYSMNKIDPSILALPPSAMWLLPPSQIKAVVGILNEGSSLIRTSTVAGSPAANESVLTKSLILLISENGRPVCTVLRT